VKESVRKGSADEYIRGADEYIREADGYIRERE